MQTLNLQGEEPGVIEFVIPAATIAGSPVLTITGLDGLTGGRGTEMPYVSDGRSTYLRLRMSVYRPSQPRIDATGTITAVTCSESTCTGPQGRWTTTFAIVITTG